MLFYKYVKKYKYIGLQVCNEINMVVYKYVEKIH